MNWAHLHLPPDLVDALKFLAKKNGYQDDEPKFIYKLLKEQYPDEMGAVTKEFIEKRGDIEKAAREQMASLLKEKFRL
jgi:hypothetical protein